MIFFTTLHQNITITENAKKHQSMSKHTMTQIMVLLLRIKWQENTRLELLPEDSLFIRSKTIWT